MNIRMLGLGDNVADFYQHINTIFPGGCSFNFSIYASMLGAESAYMGIFGDDYSGRHLINTANEFRVNTARCRVFHGETPLPTIRIEGNERVFVGSNEHGVWERPLVLNQTDIAYISKFDIVHTSLYSRMEQNLDVLSACGVPISMDFGTTYSEPFFSYICPNITFAILSCRHLTEGDMKQRIEKAHTLGARYVLATRGEFGSWFFDGSEYYHCPAKMIQAKDTMGAGDSYLTAFLYHFISATKQHERATVSDILTAMERASLFSSEICKIDGSFGHGIEYKADIIID